MVRECWRCKKTLPGDSFYAKNRPCKACCIELNRAGYLKRMADPAQKAAQRERQRINAKKYRERHPERVAAIRRASQRAYTLRFKFGITTQEYDAMLSRQKGACAICGFVPSGSDIYRKGKSLAVDHCHHTGRIRGLLCDQCNRGIGQLKDDPELLLKAVAYLQPAKANLVTACPYDFPPTLRRMIDSGEL